MIYIGSWSGALKFLKKNLYMIASKKNFLIYVLLLVVIIAALVLYFFQTKEYFQVTMSSDAIQKANQAIDDQQSKPVNIAYWLCDLQVDHKQALQNSLYRGVQTYTVLSAWKKNIENQKGNPGDVNTPAQQGYHIRRMEASGRIGPIVTMDMAEDIFNEWKTRQNDKNNDFTKWKGATLYDKSFSIGDKVTFFDPDAKDYIKGVVVDRHVGLSTIDGTYNPSPDPNYVPSPDQRLILQLNDARDPPTFDIKPDTKDIVKGIKFDNIRTNYENDIDIKLDKLDLKRMQVLADEYDEDDETYSAWIFHIIDKYKPTEVTLPNNYIAFYNNRPTDLGNTTTFFEWDKIYQVTNVTQSMDTPGWYDCQITDAADSVITVHPGRLYWVPPV